MRLETLILVIAALAPFLPAWAWPRVLRDPASFDPFDGEAARWRRGRGEPEPEFVPEPEELPRIPPGMSDTEFEAWLNAEEPGRASEKIAAEMAEEEAETQVEFDLATGIANAELSIEQRRRRMEHLRREVEERKKKKI